MKAIKKFVKCRFKKFTLKLEFVSLRNVARICKTFKTENKNEVFLLFPFIWLGDLFYVFSKLERYLEAKNIEDYVIVLMSEKAKKIAAMYGFDAQVLAPNKMKKLVRLSMVVGVADKFKIMHHNPAFIYYNRANNWSGYHGLSLKDMLDICVFDNIKIDPTPPINVRNCNEVQKYFKLIGVRPEKTVVLSPHSNTLSGLSNQFWYKLCKEIKRYGFDVCCNAMPKEKQIKDVPIVNLDVAAIAAFVEKAGFFVGVRSGICDILAFTKCKKIILYPIDCSEKDRAFFSLNTMWHKEDFVELSYIRSDEYMVEKVIKNIIQERYYGD